MKHFASAELKHLHKTFVGINMGFVALILTGVLISVLGVQAWVSVRSLNDALSMRTHDQMRLLAPADAGANMPTGDTTADEGAPEAALAPDSNKTERNRDNGPKGPQFIAASTIIIPAGTSTDDITATSETLRIADNGLSLSSDTLTEYAREVYARVSDDKARADEERAIPEISDGSGFIDNGAIAYDYVMNGDGTLIVSLGSTSYITQTLSNLALTLAGVMAAALVICFIVSWFLAERAIRPIEDTWRRERQFISDASHELKTPLTVILANLSLIKDTPREPIASQMHWIESAESEARDMQGLISDMLELTKTDLISDDLVKTPIDVSSILKKSLLQFESVAFERGVVFDTEIKSPLMTKGDPALIMRLCALLIDNACKYTTDAQVYIATFEHNQRVGFIVQNRGVFIPAEDLVHIFDRFYRADKSRNAQTGGAGLGLALAKRICEVHGGTIQMTCEPIDTRSEQPLDSSDIQKYSRAESQKDAQMSFRAETLSGGLSDGASIDHRASHEEHEKRGIIRVVVSLPAETL